MATVNNVYELITDMGFGWNLGNTFECWVENPDRNDVYRLARNTPTSWGTPTTRTWYFDAIKNAGFKTIRIPISWDNHVNQQTNTIDVEYLDYINEFVSYVVNTLDMYCIINMHHDDRIWFNTDTMISNPEKLVKYNAMWRQIATYFKDYGQKLIFAGLNEPLDSLERWDNTDATGLANVNIISQNFFDTVRSVAGNEDRYLCLNTYASKVYALRTLIMPDNKCFADVHIYNTDTSHIKSLIDQAVSFGKPFIIGEFGLSKEGFSSIENVSSQSFMITYARTKGVSCILWDDYGNMQFLKRNKITKNNYTDPSHFNGHLIDTPKMFVESNVIKPTGLETSTRRKRLKASEIINVYPSEAKLDVFTYNFSSDVTVARFVDGSSSTKLTGVAIGEATILSISPYGYVAEEVITVTNEDDTPLDNYTISLQNINNWGTQLVRTIDVLSNTLYVIKCPANYKYTLQELNVKDDVLKTTVITDNYDLQTSIVTKKLRILIEHQTENDYNTLRKDFYNNTVDMTIPYSKYQDENVQDYAEQGVFVPKLLTRTSKLLIETRPESRIIYCDNIAIGQNAYNILDKAEVINLMDDIEVQPANTTQAITFNAVDPSIVKVSVKGVVTPLKEGQTQIIVTCGEETTQCNISVDYSVVVAKASLGPIIIEQTYVQTLMTRASIDNADKIEADALLELSNTMLNSNAVTSNQIYTHINLVQNKLFEYSYRNALYYKYISAKPGGGTYSQTTNLLFDDTKKLVVTFGITFNNQTVSFITGDKFSLRIENRNLRITYGSNNPLFNNVLTVNKISVLEIQKRNNSAPFVLDGQVLQNVTTNTISSIPLSITNGHQNVRILNIKVYDYQTNELLNDLMPSVHENEIGFRDMINDITSPMGTTDDLLIGNWYD